MSASNSRRNARVSGKPKDGDALFLFDRNYNNPTQKDVDAYFQSKPDSNPDQLVDILQRTKSWKKKKNIDVLSGDNLHFVMSALTVPGLKLPTLRLTTSGILESLQVIPIVDIEKSGTWCTPSSNVCYLTLTFPNNL